jgi:hypothetical protein
VSAKRRKGWGSTRKRSAFKKKARPKPSPVVVKWVAPDALRISGKPVIEGEAGTEEEST